MSASVRAILARHRPGLRVDSIVEIGAGRDNVAYQVNLRGAGHGDLIVRVARKPDAAEVEREARMLAAIAEIATVRVPVPLFVDPAAGCLAYVTVPGVPLLDVPPSLRPVDRVAVTIGGLLAALHALPVARVAGLADVVDEPPAGWLAEAADTFATLASTIPAAHHRPIEAFLSAAPPDPAPTVVFSHNDLGIEHILVDPVTCAVTGVIDWGDAALTDPAYDFGKLYRDLGPAALDTALAAYGDRTPHDRAIFYARCGALEDLAYGVETADRRYTDKTLDALDWLFPA